MVYIHTGLNNLLSSLIGGGNLGNTAASADRGRIVVVVFCEFLTVVSAVLIVSGE